MNDAERREYKRLWRKANKTPEREARAREARAKWRKANLEAENAGQRPDKRREYKRLWRIENATPERKAKAREASARWQTANRERQNAYQRLRRGNAKLAAPKSRSRSNLLRVETTAASLMLGNALFVAASSAVPKTLPPHVREDAISSIIVAVLSGEIAEAAIGKHAKRFVAEAWGPVTVSLDAIIPGTDKLRLADTLSNDTVHV